VILAETLDRAPVRSLQAFITRAFYAALLLDGQTVGEAVSIARKQVRNDHPADPTWLAYRCFGDPHARMEIGEPDAKGESEVQNTLDTE
jgi:hypothetical protein